MIKAAVEAGARVLAGGTALSGHGLVLRADGALAETPEPEAALAGAFGPVLAGPRGRRRRMRRWPRPTPATFALGASVWGREPESRRVAGAPARRRGWSRVNEAVTPTAHAAAPFGGCKASGYGRTHGVLGLREFATPQVLFDRRPGGFRPQLFPYSRSATIGAIPRVLSPRCSTLAR